MRLFLDGDVTEKLCLGMLNSETGTANSQPNTKAQFKYRASAVLN